jgi:hypothetical protein
MPHKPRFATVLSLAGMVAVVTTALPAVAQAPDPAQEAATGGLHAGLAAKAATIEQSTCIYTIRSIVWWDLPGRDLMPTRRIHVRSSGMGRFLTRPTQPPRPN